MALGQIKQNKIIKASLNSRPAPFTSWDKDMAEGNGSLGFYLRKYGTPLITHTKVNVNTVMGIFNELTFVKKL